MLLQRLDNNLTLTLPDDLIWTDEHHWTASICKTDYLLTGSLLIETGVRQKGRPSRCKLNLTWLGSRAVWWINFTSGPTW
jgi:hypothetical protein